MPSPAALGWRASDSLTIKADALWSQYEIKENQFQTWYGNNITGNWANGNSGDLQRPGQFLPDRQRLGGGGRTQRGVSELRERDRPLRREAHAGRCRTQCRVEIRSLGQHRGPFLLGRLAPQSMAGHLSVGPVSAQSGVQRHRRAGTVRRDARLRSRRSVTADGRRLPQQQRLERQRHRPERRSGRNQGPHRGVRVESIARPRSIVLQRGEVWRPHCRIA